MRMHSFQHRCHKGQCDARINAHDSQAQVGVFLCMLAYGNVMCVRMKVCL